MALTILSSNRIETLQARLRQHLAAAPLGEPFAPEIIVVPTFAMGRWLNLRMAQQQGIAANTFYPQLGEWVWRLASSTLTDLPPLDPYSSAALAWQVFRLLPELLEQKAFATLQAYLLDDHTGIKRWQLAQRIGDSFDRYQSYRPQTIQAWSRGDDDQWQARLWRALLEHRGLAHRVGTMSRLIEFFAGSGDVSGLPQRVSLFALSNLPPLYLDLLRALAPLTEMNLYLHSPSDQYWADLDNEKRKTRRRLAAPGQQDLFDAGNELLASWGRQGQVFQDLLLNRVSAESIDIDMFAKPGDDSLLSRIQRSIFTLEPASDRLEPDQSLSIHVCHSAMRECQVLLDQVLAMLDQDAELNPEDILVMVPDIAAYAPYIEAVFQQQRIACNISDITLADEHPLVVAFLQLLGLPQSRFTTSEILALLDNESIRLRFDIDDRALAQIRRLVEQGHTRWGIDADHKADFDLPTTPGNTWQQVRDRFFAGYALAEDELWQGIAPLSVGDDTDALALGRFWHFFERLRSWRARLGNSRGAAEWQILLMQLLEDFFIETDPRESRLQQIRDAIGEMQSAGRSEISPRLLVYLMDRMLKTSERRGQLYSGGITFCGMRPMRSIPFKIICLLGMNRNDFPRRDPHSDFEIMAASPHAGDPSNRSEDRYLMLETLLCARQKLYLSYTGRSQRDNSELQPSVLIQELLDYVDSCFAAGSTPQKFSEQLIRVHPMQAFSRSSFTAPVFSYRQYWCDVAAQLAQPALAAARAWPQRALPQMQPGETIDLEQLRRFLANPIQYFYRRRLGLYLEAEDLSGDDETFDLSHLEQWRLKHQLASDCLRERSDASQRLMAEGLLAHGHAAAAQVAGIKQDQADWFDRIGQYRGIRQTMLNLELELEAAGRLCGSVTDYYPGKGLMAYHGGNFKGRQLLALWLDHLALCAANLWRENESSLLLCKDKTWRLAPLSESAASKQLADYCHLYREGMTRPLPIFPDASFTWAREADQDKALARALRPWQNQWGLGGDNTNPYIRLVLRGGYELPIGNSEFDCYAQRLYAQLLDSGEML